MTLELSCILIMLFIIIYAAIINIFTILFRMTGLTKEKTTFQVVSLFTGAGFTTSESEIITTEHTRRKIAMFCMITGNVFSVIIVSLIVNLLSNLNITDSAKTFMYIGIAFVIFVTIFIIFKIPIVKKLISKLIERIVIRMFSKDKTENFLTLLDNYGENAIVEVYVNTMPDELKGNSIYQSGLKDRYNINILMIKRRERAINVSKDTMIQERDQIVVFGNYARIKECFMVKKEKNKPVEKESINQVELIDNYGTEAMVKISIQKLPEVMKNKSIEDSKLKALYGINVLMVKRGNMVIEINRHTLIEENDEIIAFGPLNNINYLFMVE